MTCKFYIKIFDRLLINVIILKYCTCLNVFYLYFKYFCYLFQNHVFMEQSTRRIIVSQLLYYCHITQIIILLQYRLICYHVKYQIDRYKTNVTQLSVNMKLNVIFTFLVNSLLMLILRIINAYYVNRKNF